MGHDQGIKYSKARFHSRKLSHRQIGPCTRAFLVEVRRVSRLVCKLLALCAAELLGQFLAGGAKWALLPETTVAGEPQIALSQALVVPVELAV